MCYVIKAEAQLRGPLSLASKYVDELDPIKWDVANCPGIKQSPLYFTTPVFCDTFIWNLEVLCDGHSSHMDWKNGKTFSSQGNVREFWTDWESQGFLPQNTGKMREFYPKYWKSKEILVRFYFCFFSDFLIKV